MKRAAIASGNIAVTKTNTATWKRLSAAVIVGASF
jgi:hypothetical protein